MGNHARGKSRSDILIFVGWTNVSDTTLDMLSRHGTLLDSLTISRCGAVSDTGISHLAERCPGLRELHLAQCNRVSDTSLDKLASNCHELLILERPYALQSNHRHWTWTPSQRMQTVTGLTLATLHGNHRYRPVPPRHRVPLAAITKPRVLQPYHRCRNT